MMYAYARVSAKDQNLQRQIAAFREFGIEKSRIFSEKKSGKDFERKEYKRLLKNQFTENDILEFVADLLQGNPADKDYQKKLIDNLVVKVFVGDGYITAHIKLGNATEVADIRLEEVKKALEHIFNCVQTLSPLAQREGFEPSVPLRGTHDFQSCSLGRSDISASALYALTLFIINFYLNFVNLSGRCFTDNIAKIPIIMPAAMLKAHTKGSCTYREGDSSTSTATLVRAMLLQIAPSTLTETRLTFG